MKKQRIQKVENGTKRQKTPMKHHNTLKRKVKKEGHKIRQKKFLLDLCFGSRSAGQAGSQPAAGDQALQHALAF